MLKQRVLKLKEVNTIKKPIGDKDDKYLYT